jgi:hypothetical protein
MQKTQVIKLDIDLDHGIEKRYHLLDEFVRTRKLFLETLGYKVDEIQTEETQHGYHIIIILNNNISIEEAFRLQFLLGDDIHRVNFNFTRLTLLGDKMANYFNLLFTKKYKLRYRKA